MLAEALEAPAGIARLVAADAEAYAAFGADLRSHPPQSLLTIARGSSDHAAHYAAYLIMARLGRVVASLPMSIVTLYQSRLRCAGLVALAFSQSGQSHDLVLPTRYFRDGGARTAAFVNDTASPLAAASQWVFDLCAGPETSVAATKSCLAQLVAGARLVAAWQDDRSLQAALHDLPARLHDAAAAQWQPALDVLGEVDRLFVISRGLGLPIAMEAALKLKEVCGVQAEAFSGAELRHGPLALVEQGYPLLVFAPRGPAQPGLLALAEEMRRAGARVVLAAPVDVRARDVTLVTAADVDLDPICALQSFYPMVEAMARARGLDPDAPPHLRKVTVTS
jgi:glucosamine--fructose-6-phosphate aminotransferase (isomerizing)